MEFVKVPEIPRQRDGWACGPLCLCFIQQRLQLPEFYETANWQKMKNPGSGQLSLKLFRELQIRASESSCNLRFSFILDETHTFLK